MIRYTQFAASQEVPPPDHFPGVTVNAFVWEAELGPIQKYCDTYFNLGSKRERGFVYRPAAFWPYVLLLFIEYPVMISSAVHENVGTEVPYPDRGIIKQTEVFVAVPVVRYGATPTKLLLESAIEWALPFIVVSNPMSASCGREMLGLGKLLAKIETTEGRYPDSFRGAVILPGWANPRKKQEMLPFVNVETAPPLPTSYGGLAGQSAWSPFQSREAGWMIDGLACVNGIVGSLIGGVAPTVMRTVSLRQFRDALDPRRAIYQALESCRCKYSNVNQFCFYNENDVHIAFNDQGSFVEILDAFLPHPRAGEPPLKITPQAAFRFNADIDFDEMRTIHTFPVDDGPASVTASSDLTAPAFRPLRGLFGPAMRRLGSFPLSPPSSCCRHGIRQAAGPGVLSFRFASRW